MPGNYFSIQTDGTVVGNTYLEAVGDSTNAYQLLAYTVSTTPAPTPTPLPIPTSAPSGSPVLVIYYFGEYNIPIVAASGFAANATTGCFGLLTAQPVGTTTGFEAFGQGNPVFAAPQPNATTASQGAITSLTITNLTPTTGTGTFTFDIGTIGTITITGSVTETITLPLAMSRPRPGLRKR